MAMISCWILFSELEKSFDNIVCNIFLKFLILGKRKDHVKLNNLMPWERIKKH